MKPKNTLFILFLIFCTNSIVAQDQNDVKAFYNNNALFKFDTVISNVNIQGEKFSIKILRDKIDEHLIPFAAEANGDLTLPPITLLISDANDKIVYAKKFDGEPNEYPYIYYSFYKGQRQKISDPGKLFFLMNKGYGGSGSDDLYYYIDRTKDQVTCTKLFNASGELSFLLHNKADNELLLLNGIWYMGGDEAHFEAHFDDHRYSITRYAFREGHFYEKETVRTKFKYACPDDSKPIRKILVEMKAKEPALFKQIKVKDYLY